MTFVQRISRRTPSRRVSSQPHSLAGVYAPVCQARYAKLDRRAESRVASLCALSRRRTSLILISFVVFREADVFSTETVHRLYHHVSVTLAWRYRFSCARPAADLTRK